MTEEEEFFAWLDGELAPADAARVAKRVADDPALTELAHEHRTMQASLSQAFESLAADDCQPPTFNAENVAPLAAKSRTRGVFGSGISQIAAIAASLVVGLVAGNLLKAPGSDPVEMRGDVLVASADLDRALDSRLASVPVNEDVRIGLTFRNRSGEVCRSFSGAKGSGLACRRGDDWRIEALFGASEDISADYRMASGGDPRVAAQIDRMIVGEPFGADAERAARDSDWR